jgi:hypothetical protein
LQPFNRTRLVFLSTLSTVALTVGALVHAAPADLTPLAAPTFSKDIAPILQRSCQDCHRPGAMAPMSLLTYSDVRPWANALKQRVATRAMPPWQIDHTIGIQKYKNDLSLSNAEIATMVRWVDSGAPEGNRADLPPTKEFQPLDVWQIGTPDLIVEVPETFTVRPAAPDVWPLITVDPHLTEDRYLMAVEGRPLEGFEVVHHLTINAVAPGSEGVTLGDGASQGVFLTNYALGKNGDVYSNDAGRLLKAGSKITFNTHFHSIGEERKVRIALGLKFYPKGYVPKHVNRVSSVGQVTDLDIPPNGSARTDGYTFLSKASRLISFQPHMHNLGKSMCLEAIYPRVSVEHPSQTETFSCVDNFDFTFRQVYEYQEDAQPILPAGTVLHVIAVFDNSHANKRSTDPENWVGYGNRVNDEMSFAWVDQYDLTDEEYRQMTTERAAKKKQPSLSRQ